MFRHDYRLKSAVLLATSASVAFACGYYFPNDPVLEYRDVALLEAPAHSFTAYVQTLAAVEHKGLVLNESAETAAEWEANHLPKAQRFVVQQMRESGNSTIALELGKDLPPAMRLYVAGAVAFHAAAPAEAKGLFEAVLALPEEQARSHAAWAAFMIARLRADANDTAGAATAYELVRRLVTQGAEDPLGLAVTSYGQQGGLALAAGDETGAAAWYARQAAHGSMSARNSLIRIAQDLVSPKMSARLLEDPILQRLAIAYALELDDEEFFDWNQGDESSDNEVIDQADGGAESMSPSFLLRLMDRVEALPPDTWADPAPLAVAAYRVGHYEYAARFAVARDTPETRLIRAKLAMRAGDLDTAITHYEAAAMQWDAASMPVLGADDLAASRDRTLAEWSAARLGQEDFVEALRLMVDAGPLHWSDAAYLAERILTLDELKTFVDFHAPRAVPPTRRWKEIWSESGEEGADAGCYWRSGCLASPIRDLLARRLMREGRGREALAYYTASVSMSAEEGSAAVEVGVAELASGYLAALDRSQSAWTSIGRSQAAFEAARMAREYGMELMGYEFDPDYSFFEGMLHASSGEPMEVSKLVTAEELRREEATRPRIDRRFHYRYLAVEQALQAADGLPPRSQAFAGVLCEATRWIINADSNMAAAIYSRYLREGPYVAWGADFGRICPKPEFAAARELQWRQELQGLRIQLRPWKWPIYGAGLLMIGGVAVLIGWRMRPA